MAAAEAEAEVAVVAAEVEAEAAVVAAEAEAEAADAEVVGNNGKQMVTARKRQQQR
jgi:hypothetical protein